MLPVLDTLHLTPHTDLVVMMARYAATNQRDVRRAAECIRSETIEGTQILPILSMEWRAWRAYRYSGYHYEQEYTS